VWHVVAYRGAEDQGVVCNRLAVDAGRAVTSRNRQARAASGPSSSCVMPPPGVSARFTATVHWCPLPHVAGAEIRDGMWRAVPLSRTSTSIPFDLIRWALPFVMICVHIDGQADSQECKTRRGPRRSSALCRIAACVLELVASVLSFPSDTSDKAPSAILDLLDARARISTPHTGTPPSLRPPPSSLQPAILKESILGPCAAGKHSVQGFSSRFLPRSAVRKRGVWPSLEAGVCVGSACRYEERGQRNSPKGRSRPSTTLLFKYPYV